MYGHSTLYVNKGIKLDSLRNACDLLTLINIVDATNTEKIFNINDANKNKNKTFQRECVKIHHKTLSKCIPLIQNKLPNNNVDYIKLKNATINQFVNILCLPSARVDTPAGIVEMSRYLLTYKDYLTYTMIVNKFTNYIPGSIGYGPENKQLYDTIHSKLCLILFDGADHVENNLFLFDQNYFYTYFLPSTVKYIIDLQTPNSFSSYRDRLQNLLNSEYYLIKWWYHVIRHVCQIKGITLTEEAFESCGYAIWNHLICKNHQYYQRHLAQDDRNKSCILILEIRNLCRNIFNKHYESINLCAVSFFSDAMSVLMAQNIMTQEKYDTIGMKIIFSEDVTEYQADDDMTLSNISEKTLKLFENYPLKLFLMTSQSDLPPLGFDMIRTMTHKVTHSHNYYIQESILHITNKYNNNNNNQINDIFYSLFLCKTQECSHLMNDGDWISNLPGWREHGTYLRPDLVDPSNLFINPSIISSNGIPMNFTVCSSIKTEQSEEKERESAFTFSMRAYLKDVDLSTLFISQSHHECVVLILNNVRVLTPEDIGHDVYKIVPSQRFIFRDSWIKDVDDYFDNWVDVKGYDFKTHILTCIDKYDTLGLKDSVEHTKLYLSRFEQSHIVEVDSTTARSKLYSYGLMIDEPFSIVMATHNRNHLIRFVSGLQLLNKTSKIIERRVSIINKIYSSQQLQYSTMTMVSSTNEAAENNKIFIIEASNLRKQIIREQKLSVILAHPNDKSLIKLKLKHPQHLLIKDLVHHKIEKLAKHQISELYVYGTGFTLTELYPIRGNLSIFEVFTAYCLVQSFMVLKDSVLLHAQIKIDAQYGDRFLKHDTLTKLLKLYPKSMTSKFNQHKKEINGLFANHQLSKKSFCNYSITFKGNKNADYSFNCDLCSKRFFTELDLQQHNINNSDVHHQMSNINILENNMLNAKHSVKEQIMSSPYAKKIKHDQILYWISAPHSSFRKLSVRVRSSLRQWIHVTKPSVKSILFTTDTVLLNKINDFFSKSPNLPYSKPLKLIDIELFRDGFLKCFPQFESDIVLMEQQQQQLFQQLPSSYAIPTSNNTERKQDKQFVRMEVESDDEKAMVLDDNDNDGVIQIHSDDDDFDIEASQAMFMLIEDIHREFRNYTLSLKIMDNNEGHPHRDIKQTAKKAEAAAASVIEMLQKFQHTDERAFKAFLQEKETTKIRLFWNEWSENNPSGQFQYSFISSLNDD